MVQFKKGEIRMSDDVKKYTSIYEIKDYALNILGPKYFPEDVIEGYNIGF